MAAGGAGAQAEVPRRLQREEAGGREGCRWKEASRAGREGLGGGVQRRAEGVSRGGGGSGKAVERGEAKGNRCGGEGGGEGRGEEAEGAEALCEGASWAASRA